MLNSFKTITKHLETIFKIDKVWYKEFILAIKACEQGDIEIFEKYYHHKNKYMDLMEMLNMSIDKNQMKMFKHLISKKNTFESQKEIKKYSAIISSLSEDGKEPNPLNIKFYNIGKILMKLIQSKDIEKFKYVIENVDLIKDLQYLPTLKSCLITAIHNDQLNVIEYMSNSESFGFLFLDEKFKVDVFRVAVGKESQKTLDYLINKYDLDDDFWKKWDDAINGKDIFPVFKLNTVASPFKSIKKDNNENKYKKFKESMMKRELYLSLNESMSQKDIQTRKKKI